MNYDLDYFIKKFEAIPEEQWTTGVLENGSNQKCALGHCGVTETATATAESTALREIFAYRSFDAVDVNDGRVYRYRQSTPKARILSALRDLK